MVGKGMHRRGVFYRLPGTVYEAALNRIRWVWDEFDGNVSVSISGGKDSTVVMFLALQVARERGTLPLRVHWLDQECELEATADYVREHIAKNPDIDFDWYQIPFRLFNATNHTNEWLDVWGEGREWVREKEPDSIQVNDFGVDRFTEVLHAIGDREGGAVLTGVRAEESPARRLGLTSYVTHKWATWGSKGKRHVVFHPIYDWTYRDVWKAIHDGSWPYNRIYDVQHQYGVPVLKMRVSNYHHETALATLWWLQEVEPETWEKAVSRLEGVNTAGHAGADDFFVKALPFMFSSWAEYHEHLVANLVPKEENRAIFRKHFADLVHRLPYVDVEEIAAHCVQAVIANDLYFTKGNQFYVTHHKTKAELAVWRAEQEAAS